MSRMTRWIAIGLLLAPAMSALAEEKHQEGAVTACQKHVSRLLHSAVNTDFGQNSDLRIATTEPGRIEVRGSLRTVDTAGKARVGDYTCKAERFSERLWGTKTELAITK